MIELKFDVYTNDDASNYNYTNSTSGGATCDGDIGCYHIHMMDVGAPRHGAEVCIGTLGGCHARGSRPQLTKPGTKFLQSPRAFCCAPSAAAGKLLSCTGDLGVSECWRESAGLARGLEG